MVVTWSTWKSVGTPFVIYNQTFRADGFSKLFSDYGSLHRQQYFHRVTLKNLSPNSTYSEFFFSFFIKNLNIQVL